MSLAFYVVLSCVAFHSVKNHHAQDGGVRVRMSGAEERQARSVALEKAYVHEVYEQISNSQYPPANTVPRGRTWPKVKQFLAELEPGSLVCDVGCGNGKYLNVNPSVFKVGADRCSTLTDMAREKEHEVMLCDNLALPFRDETFDAVLSVAVVHHFATTERRVGALRELARVLRIGGRLIISVWAMEQRHRKFESQDVLVPWHRPQHLSTPSLELTSTTTTSEEDLPPPYHAYTQTSDSDSCRSVKAGVGQRKRGRSRHKGRSIDPARPCSSSQSSSSLSSPNETCYSFVRRALQKLAGGKRGGSRHRPWFMDSWNACTKEPPAHRYDPEGCEDGEDIQDLPIELRRLEEDHDAPQRRQTFACAREPTHHEVSLNHKSKSLSDILTVGQRSMVRSRSSVPSLGVPVMVEPKPLGERQNSIATSGAKPRLVKQKKSVCEEEGEEEGDEPTDMRDLVKALPEFKVIHGSTRRCGGVFKQSSMNEELMSTERLREKEKVRQNIQKQASLNEELIYRRHPRLDSLRDTLFSTSTAKRFQILKNGLTNKLKNSTTGIEKVAGSSFKNGFVRILQGWKGSEVSPNVRPFPTPNEPMPPRTPPADCMKPPNCSAYDPLKDSVRPGERRHSKEDGSDSSKDSSLQSDTSVDSEDSFASVIFVPKPDPPPDPTNQNGVTSPLQVPLQVSPPKSPHPTSPTVKHSSQPTSPRIKQPPMSPTFKQPFSPPKPMLPSMKPISPSIKTMPPLPTIKTPSPPADEPVLRLQPLAATGKKPREAPKPVTPEEPQPPSAESASDSKHSERLRQIKELLRTRTSSRITGGSSSRSPFPMVRRSTTLSSNRSETLTRPIPRLLSLELFNPETDDMDSDSSGVSSPDSVSSVISVLTEEVQLPPSTATGGAEASGLAADAKDITPTNPEPPRDASSPQALAELTERLLEVQMDDEIAENKSPSSHSLRSSSPPPSPSLFSLTETTTKPSPPPPPTPVRGSPSSYSLTEMAKPSLSSYSLMEEHTFSPRGSPSSLSLLEAAQDVASSLEDAVETVIQSSPRARRKQLAMLDGDPMSILSGYSSGGSTWSLHKGLGYDSGSDWSLNVERLAETIVKADSLSPDSWSVNNSGRSSRKVSPRRRRSRAQATGPEPWDENCRQHLTDFAEKLSEKLLEEIDQYRMQTSQPPVVPRRSSHSRVLPGLPEGLEHMDDPYLSRLNEELQDLTKLSAELQERNSFLASYNNEPINVSPSQPTITIESPKQLKFENNFESLLSPKVNREDITKPPITNNSESVDCSVKIELDLVNTEVVKDIETWTASLRQSSEDVIEDLVPIVELERVDENEEDCLKQEETVNVMDSRIVVTPALDDSEPSTVVKSEELLVRDEVLRCRRKSQGTLNQEDNSSNPSSTRNSGSLASLKPGYSLESSDAGDVSEQTASGSDGSRRDTNSAGKTASTASLGPESSDAGSERLGSGSDCSRDLRYADRRTARCDGRSSSEEAPPRMMLVRQRASIQEPPEALTKTESCASSLSGSTSQESLPSDNGGGSLTFHRYYHVFREGELDQLIEKYVENLHIISSYYDHANWCVVAEKVQVWTI